MTTKIFFFRFIFSKNSSIEQQVRKKNRKKDALDQVNSSCSKYISLKEKPSSKINLRRGEGSIQVELMLGYKHKTKYRSEDLQNK